MPIRPRRWGPTNVANQMGGNARGGIIMAERNVEKECTQKQSNMTPHGVGDELDWAKLVLTEVADRRTTKGSNTRRG
jgi:hypothetical protein